MFSFSGQPNSNSRRAALADVKNRQALHTTAPTAHESKVPTVISRDILPPSEAPLTFTECPPNFHDLKFVGVTVANLKTWHMNPGDKEPTRVKRPYVVANMAMISSNSEGANSRIDCAVPLAALHKFKHKDAGLAAKRMYAYYDNKIAKYGQPPSPIEPRLAATSAPAQHARIANPTAQPHQKPSLLAQLSKKLSFSA